MEMIDYKIGDDVEVLISNPRLDGKEEWRPAEVVNVQMVERLRSEPYPVVIVKVERTYCKAEPIYEFFGNIPIFIENYLEYYEKENQEGFLFKNTIRLKSN